MSAGGVDRQVVLVHLQRAVAPFLSIDAIEARLANVEASGVLGGCVTDAGYDLIATLNACFHDHPALFEDLEQRALHREIEWLDRVERGEPPAGPARYRIEQRVRLVDRFLPESSLLQLFVPAPRDIPGFQRARLISAEPAGLADHYLPVAGQIYAAPFAIEAGRPVPPLRMVFEVETSPEGGGSPADGTAPPRSPFSPPAAEWAAGHVPDPCATARERVAAVIDGLENDFQFALIGATDGPVPLLLTARAGNVLMQASLLAESLRSLGLAASLGAAQRLFLDGGASHLRYVGSPGYDHVFVQWSDPTTGEAGVVDLSYLGRWGFVASEDNAPSVVLRQQLDQVGDRARVWLRENLYPIDLVVAGPPRESRVQVFASGDDHWLRVAVDVDIVAERT